MPGHPMQLLSQQADLVHTQCLLQYSIFRRQRDVLDRSASIVFCLSPHGQSNCRVRARQDTNNRCVLQQVLPLRVLDAVQPNSQYNGYMSPIEVQWQNACYGGNYGRLQGVKSAYGPINMFGKPFSPKAPMVA